MQFSRIASRVFIAAVLALAVMSCVKQKKDPGAPPESMGASVPAPEQSLAPAGTAVAQAGGEKRYYKDKNGQLYYVDKDGALHTVSKGTRVEVSPGAPAPAEGEAPAAYRDGKGKVYYLDKDGKVLMIEDDTPGKPMDPMPLLQGTDMENKVVRGMRQGECEKLLQDCLAGCASRSTEAGRKACYDSCEQTRAACGKGN